ncbi:MAG TPA: hypothetical protein VN253_17575 [Kofleriaceae bacterium]|nr:hypothetical protein [Kofleriaceae bacterium]
MGLKYLRASGGPNCFESPDVRIVNDERDIPFTGRLSAVLARTDSERDSECDCQVVGMIFDDETTLIVDCLHSDDEVNAFRTTCRDNMIDTVNELAIAITGPCPPPKNQAALGDWTQTLFRNYRSV